MTMRPSDRARERGVTELLHFTTSNGLIGILHKGTVLSRGLLEIDDYLENIKILNSPDRSRDIAWVNWVNLSVSQVNSAFLGHSKGWHVDDDIWWACLSFDVSLLDHDDVYFCTGNNAYTATTRGQGVDGFEALFAPRVVWGMYNTPKYRPTDHPPHLPTDEQAEVLYPGGIDLSYLRAVYVPEPDHLDEVAGIVEVTGTPDRIDLTGLAVTVAPEIFQ
jgi:hypothetical protein